MAIRNYNAFLRAVKREHGVTHKQAQSAYRKASLRLGRPAKGVDVTRHPRIVKESTRGGSKSRSSAKRASAARGGSRSVRGGARPLRTIEEWNDHYDEVDYEVEEIVSSADYGRKE